MATDRTAAQAHADGMVVRREVLSDEHVDRAQEGVSPLTADYALVVDRDVRPWADSLAVIRDVSRAAAAVTLGHSGARGATRPRSKMTDVPMIDPGDWGLLAASPLRYTPRSQVPFEMTRPYMDDVTEDFVTATGLAASARFDMVEIHMGHGYLLGSFISPLTNHRSDEYGGQIADRMRYPLEVFDAVRTGWPSDRPMGVALNVSDWAPGGTSLSDAVAAAVLLKEHGCDVIRVLAGQTTAKHAPRYDAYSLTHYADRIRNEARIATIATGDITTVDHANTIVAGGRADLCLLRISGV
jgi:anthraniloyl-CoA monooxygenase